MVTKMIGERGEIVIPKNIREHKGLSPKRKVEIIEVDGGIMIVPLVKDFKELAGLFQEHRKVDLKKLDIDVLDLMHGV